VKNRNNYFTYPALRLPDCFLFWLQGVQGGIVGFGLGGKISTVSWTVDN